MRSRADAGSARLGGRRGGTQGINDVPFAAPPGLVKRTLQGHILATAGLTGLFSR